MAAPVASVDIANLALDRLGADPVSSIVNPAVPNADICARWYDQTRRQMLRKYIFNFSRKTDLLVISDDAPTHPEFTNGFLLPNDFIRLLTIGDRILYGGAVPTEFFDFSEGYLYCDERFILSSASSAPTLTISAIYKTGDTVSGVVVPAGYTVVVVSGTPISGAQYQISAVVGATQANGNTYQIVAGTLGNAGAVYFLQTTAGFNFDSSSWSTYVSGGQATPTYIPPGSTEDNTGLQVNYTYDAVNVRKFDSLFVDVLVLQLAVNMCKGVTKRDPSDKLLAELKNADLAAAAVAGQEKPPRSIQRSRLRDVRRAGGIFRNNTVIGGSGSSIS